MQHVAARASPDYCDTGLKSLRQSGPGLEIGLAQEGPEMPFEDIDAASEIAAGLLPADFDLGRISGRGSCNQVFRADAGSRSIIIRLNSDRDPREFQKEAWCMARAADAGVSVAKPLGHGNLHGWNYGVQSFEGEMHGEDAEDQHAIWEFLGRSAALFHGVGVTGLGDVLLDEAKGAFDGEWQTYVGDNIRALATDAPGAGMNDAQASALVNSIESLATRQFQIGLCHGDLTPRNVVLDGSRTTLIDWGCAHAHIVPHFDFRELLRKHAVDSLEVRSFLAGYDGDFDEAVLLSEVNDLLLLCAFDLIRWARDRAPDQLQVKTEEFRKLVDQLPGN